MKLTLPARSVVLDRCRAIWHWARQELSVWVSPLHNPFVGQARRAESRGKSLWRVPLLMAFLWMGPMLLDWLASFDVERDLANDGALFWIGIALLVAFIGRLLRCEATLRIEIIKGRFEPLQLMPIEAARRAWLWCAPATLFALLTCALALPALMWGLGSGLLTLSDALGLALLALMLCWGRPLWRPKMWRGQIAKTNADANNRSDGFEAPSAPPNDLGVWLSCAGIVTIILWFSGVGGAALPAYWQGLPAYLRATGDEFWMTWPLFIARWLMRAQPFFGFGLAPIFLVLPASVAGAVVGVLRLGAVTGIEPYWTEARLQLWHRARKTRALAWTILAFGLLWPGSVNAAWMGVWFVGAPINRETALATWWIVALAIASLGASALWWRALGATPVRVTLLSQLKSAGRVATRGVALVAAAFLIVHVLGLAWPFGAFWRHIAPASLAVAAVFVGAQTVTWGGMRAPQLESALWRWHLLWLCAGPVVYIVPNFIDFDTSQFQPTIFFFSPWTLWITLRDADIGSNPAFWNAIAVHGGLIAATALYVWRARETWLEANQSPMHDNAATVATTVADAFKPAPAEPIAPIENDDADDEEEEDEDEEIVPDKSNATLRRAPLEAPHGPLQGLLAWLERFDNPLLLLETRRVIGNELSNTIYIAQIASGIAVAVLVLALPMLGVYNGAYPFALLTMALCLILLIWWATPLLGTDGASRAYDHDRLDGSLQALFLTPRTESEIALGKLGPFLARGALMLLLFGPMWALGFLFCFYAGEPLLTAAYAAMPFFAAGFALRSATTSHWMALTKRRVGSSSVPTSITLSAIIALPTEASLLIWGGGTGAFAFFGAALGLSLVFAAEAWLMWRLGLRALRRWRDKGAPGVD